MATQQTTQNQANIAELVKGQASHLVPKVDSKVQKFVLRPSLTEGLAKQKPDGKSAQPETGSANSSEETISELKSTPFSGDGGHFFVLADASYNTQQSLYEEFFESVSDTGQQSAFGEQTRTYKVATDFSLATAPGLEEATAQVASIGSPAMASLATTTGLANLGLVLGAVGVATALHNTSTKSTAQIKSENATPTIADTTNPAQTLSITAITDNFGLYKGTIVNGAETDDTSLELSGTLSATLDPGDTVRVYDGNSYLGNATVNGTQWSFADTRTLINGQTVSYSASVSDAAGNEGQLTTTYTATVNTNELLPTTIDLGSVGQLINRIKVENNYYYVLDTNKDNLMDGTDMVGLFQVEKLAFGGFITENNRKLTINGVNLSVPTAGFPFNSTIASSFQTLIAGTGWSHATTGWDTDANSNPSYDDYAAIWDAFNGVDTVTSTSAAIPGWPSDATTRYWTAEAQPSAWRGLFFCNGQFFANSYATLPGYVAFQVLDIGIPKYSVSITEITDDVGSLVGIIANGEITNDTQLVVRGTLSDELRVQDTLRVYDGDTYLGDAIPTHGSWFRGGWEASNFSWSYADTRTLIDGQSVNYKVHLIDSVGKEIALSNSYAATIDNSPPSQTISINAITDDVGPIQGTVSSGSETDDNSLELSGTLSATLGPGDTVRVYDGNSYLGNATVNGTQWSFADTRTLINGQTVSYSASVSDAAGNEGQLATTYTAKVKNTDPLPGTIDLGSLGQLIHGIKVENQNYYALDVNKDNQLNYSGDVDVSLDELAKSIFGSGASGQNFSDSNRTFDLYGLRFELPTADELKAISAASAGSPNGWESLYFVGSSSHVAVSLNDGTLWGIQDYSPSGWAFKVL